MAAYDAKTVLLIKTLCPRIVFPNAKPHYIAVFLLSSIETGFHQRLADTLPQESLMRIQPAQLDGPFGRYAGLNVVDDDLRVTGGLVLKLRNQKDALIICQFGRDLFKV